ncbi:MAG TPA: saccharopine dehydrogenase NADP-binding domain-containing protein [Chloroflexota bacterium]|nr:saccharopine dehydrogenase NADP-binding domain-containing protein [Chloroflexota bacterium]
MLYGATGYTGRLIARRAVERGLRPRLAGRDPVKIGRLAAELGVEGRVFRLDDAPALDRALGDAPVVLHAAGPFAHTYRPMVAACLRTRVHYLDLTGEVGVFEAIAARDEAARRAGVMLLPGVGFDLVPTDCLANHLKRRLPGAIRLTLVVGHPPWRDGRGRLRMATLSRGTLATALDVMLERGLVRRDGHLVDLPAAAWGRQLRIGQGPAVNAVLFPFGELAATYRSTGIRHIETYVVLPLIGAFLLRRFGRLAGRGPLNRLAGALLPLLPPGPGDEELAAGQAVVWAQAEEPGGRRATARLVTANPYRLTADAALAVVRQVVDGRAPPGYQTPATAYGPDLVLEVVGVRREDLS